MKMNLVGDGPIEINQLEKAVISIVSRFIDLPGERMDSEIRSALGQVGPLAASDRCLAILFSEDGNFLETIWEWTGDAISETDVRLHMQPVEMLPWFTGQVKALQTIQIAQIVKLADFAPLEYAECIIEQIQSLLLLPLAYQGQPVGLLMFEKVHSTGTWSEEVIHLLKIVGEILTGAIQHNHAEERLREGNLQLEARINERAKELDRRELVGDALRDILRVLNSNRELPEVLQYIVTQANQLLKATATMIRRADLENQLVTTEASYNLPAAFDPIQQTRMYYSASDLILMSRRPVVIADLHATYQPMLEMRETLDDIQSIYIQAMLAYYRSMLSVPLFIKNEIFGSLTFFFTESREFSEEDIQLAMSLGDQAALAIENARLYREEHLRREEAERRRLVAESLRDIMAVLNSQRSLDDILQKIVTQAVKLLNTDAVAIYRLWRKEQVLVIRASYGLSEEYVNEIRIPVGRGIAGHAVMSGRPVAVSDAISTEALVGDADLLQEERLILEKLVEDYRAFLSVPLIGKDEVYGAITLYYREGRSFLQDEIELAVAFADQAALAIENARLRSQSEQNAVVMERSRLARDLHDAVTQTLFSASLIAEVLPRIWERNPEEGRRRVEELRQLSRGALAEMRTLLLELRPAALTEARLSDLLRQLAEAVTGRARLPVRIEVAGESVLDADIQVVLYRISQEALNNMVKHANAKQGEIRLAFSQPVPGEFSGQRVVLTIQDDGHGFDPARVPPNHLGLAIMMERAQSIGAQLTVESVLGQGTRVEVTWEDHNAQRTGKTAA